MAEIKDKLVTAESLRFVHDFFLNTISEKVDLINEDLANKTDALNVSINAAQDAADAAMSAADNAQKTADKKVSMKTVVATLLSTGWANNTQTVAIDGVAEKNTVIPGPAPVSYLTYAENGIYCCGQSVNSLVFVCDYVPDEDITINVVIFDKEVDNGT